jgi:hypothetical protein
MRCAGGLFLIGRFARSSARRGGAEEGRFPGQSLLVGVFSFVYSQCHGSNGLL